MRINRFYRPRTSLEPGKEKHFSIKEWIGFTTSFIAFAISVVTFYMANLRKVDDFRYGLQGVISARNGGDSFEFGSLLRGVAINGGTRAVAVESVDILISQNSDLSGDKQKDCFKNAETFYIEVAPVVIKPQDLVIQDLHKYRPLGTHTFTQEGIPIVKFADAGAAVHPLLVCLSVTFLIPEHVQQTQVEVLMSVAWKATEKFVPREMTDLLYLTEPPFVMFKQSGFAPFAN